MGLRGLEMMVLTELLVIKGLKDSRGFQETLVRKETKEKKELYILQVTVVQEVSLEQEGNLSVKAILICWCRSFKRTFPLSWAGSEHHCDVAYTALNGDVLSILTGLILQLTSVPKV